MQPQPMALEVQRLASIRRWEDENLPIYGSLLGRDLLLLLAQFHFEQRRFSLKQLYCSLPYSENAVRLHIRRLVRDGWLALSSAGPDRRFRMLVPSDKLADLLQSYLRQAGLQ